MTKADSRKTAFGSRAERVTLVMACLFATTGMTLAFLPRWLEVERGLTGAQIGVILALPQFARVLTGPVVAFWADAAADRRTPIQVLALASASAYAAFFFIPHEFPALVALGFLALTMSASVTPLIEASLLRATAAGRLTYGVARSIGSIAFMMSTVVGGAAVARFGVVALVVWVIAGFALLSASALLGLKADPSPLPLATGRTASRLDSVRNLLRSRRFLVLLVSCGLIQSAHGFYYNFSTLVWRGQGVSADIVGLLWAFGVVVEVGFLWSLTVIERRVAPEAFILAGAIGGALRWLLLGFAPAGWVLWPIQALHMLSFAAAHVGAMRLLYRDAPESSAAMAQTLYAVMTGGLLMGVSTLASGVLYDTVGAQGYWVMAAMAASGGLLSLLLFRPEPRKASSTHT